MTKIKDRDEFAKLWNSDLTSPEIGRHYGVTRQAVRAAAKRYGLPSRGRLSGGMNHVNPVEIRGVEYESQVDAARDLGVSEAAISKARARGKLDMVGLRK